MALTAAQQRIVVRRIKPIVFILCLLPLANLVYLIFTHQISADPVEDITKVTGEWGLRILIITLAITPLRVITKFNALINLRRMLGVFSFFYILLHMLTWLVIDHYFNFQQIIEDILDRWYILFGSLAFALMIPLAATSVNRAIKWIGGKRWTKLHKAVYVIAILGIVHYILLVKADLGPPIVHGIVLAILLGFRIVRHYMKSKPKKRLA